MSDWQSLSVGQLSIRVTKGTTPTLSSGGFVGEGVAFVKVESITAEGLINSDKLARVSRETHSGQSRSILQANDLLFSIAGTIGRVAQVRAHHLPANTNQAIAIIRPDESKVLPQFLLYSLRDKNRIDDALSRVVQSVQANLSLAELSAIPIELPSLPEQQAIIEVLGALDDKIAANTKLAGSAFDLASTLYNSNVNSAPVRAMSEVLNPVLGGTPSRAVTRFWGGDQLWASAKDVTGAQFGIIHDTVEKITALAVSTTKARPLPAGSVILTARGTVGAVARLAKPSAFNQSCYGFTPDEIPAGVLYFSILRAAERAKALAHGSVFDTITMKTFDHLYFPDLNGFEIARVEAIVSPLLDAITAASLLNHTLTETRDALLPQLMSGKLRVRDAEKAVEAVV